MEYRSLIQEKLPSIREDTWYRQRFDACPHFMFFLGDAHISTIQDTNYPYGQRIAYAGFSRNRADWYHSLQELEHTTEQIRAAAQQRPHLSKDMVQDFLPWQEDFYALCEKFTYIDLSSLKDEELLATYEMLAKAYTLKLNASPLIDGFALSTDTLIASQITSFLAERGEEERFVEYFATLTAPTFTSFLQEEELALLHIAEQVRTAPEEEARLLTAHQAAYFWIQNNYVKDHFLSVEDFKKRLEEYKTIDIRSRIEELENLAVSHRQDKEALIEQLGLPEEIQTLLEITDDFNAWQDERKKGTFFATHYFSLLLEEFAKRTHYSLEQLKYAFPPEMRQVLDETLDPLELNRRIAYCIILWVKDAYDVTTDPTLIEELDRIGTGKVVPSHEVKGFTASRGKVTGPVKVLESAEEIGKLEEGDILVAVMTRPDYLPAMQKAAAFVTDEGGITCHAAIVAREMKKPCVIGTKIATKVFKDGDIIEVDAEQGIVRTVGENLGTL